MRSNEEIKGFGTYPFHNAASNNFMSRDFERGDLMTIFSEDVDRGV
jgi:hypothetical protein